jgi:ribosomal protein S18 acetylase RimI-like enzyme
MAREALREPLQCRAVQVADLDQLRALHQTCFPITYEESFYEKVVNSRDGITCFVALTPTHQLVGFISARTTAVHGDARELLLPDLCGATTRRSACYILTLGVAAEFRRKGVASQLLQLVLDRCLASPSCQLVYLHTLTTNCASLELYKQHRFALAATERDFYVIRRETKYCHYDAYTLCRYINGGRPPLRALGFMGSALASSSAWGVVRASASAFHRLWDRTLFLLSG